jgi:hypothetical protein
MTRVCKNNNWKCSERRHHTSRFKDTNGAFVVYRVADEEVCQHEDDEICDAAESYDAGVL